MPSGVGTWPGPTQGERGVAQSCSGWGCPHLIHNTSRSDVRLADTTAAVHILLYGATAMHARTHTSHLPHLVVQLVRLQLQCESHSVSWGMMVLRVGLK